MEIKMIIRTKQADFVEVKYIQFSEDHKEISIVKIGDNWYSPNKIKTEDILDIELKVNI